MRHAPTILLSLFLFVIPLLAIASDRYEVTATRLNVRSGPGEEYSVIDQLNYGDVISVVDGTNPNWYQISTTKGAEGVGYVSSRYLRVPEEGGTSTLLIEEKDGTGTFLIIALIIGILLFNHFYKRWKFKRNREHRRDCYRNVYLKSDDWRRKRHVVLKRDNWHCVYCGNRATEVHHKRYLKRNLGKEPIKWLVSVCTSCHDREHN